MKILTYVFLLIIWTSLNNIAIAKNDYGLMLNGKKERVKQVELHMGEPSSYSEALSIENVTNLIIWEVSNTSHNGEKLLYTLYKKQQSGTALYEMKYGELMPGQSVTDFKFIESEGIFTPGEYFIKLSCSYPYKCSGQGYIERDPID